MTTRDTTAERLTALAQAVKYTKPAGALSQACMSAAPSHTLHVADDFFRWLTGPVSLVIRVGPIVDQDTGTPTGNVYLGGTVQLHDDEKATLDVDEFDAKGVLLPDNITWTVDDENVATIVTEPTPDNTSITWLVAGLPGSAVVTATDGTLSATLAVDVVPGDVALINIVTGDPVKQTPPVEG